MRDIFFMILQVLTHIIHILFICFFYYLYLFFAREVILKNENVHKLQVNFKFPQKLNIKLEKKAKFVWQKKYKWKKKRSL